MKFRLALVLLITILLTSCSGSPSSILDDETCDAPCWQGIVVGETSQDEALQILEQIPEVQKETLQSFSQDSISWHYQDVREWGGSLRFHENKVIVFYSAFDSSIPLKEFIKTFGDPSFVYVTSTDGVFPTMLTVGFIYPELGVCLYHQPSLLSTKRPREYVISGRTKIMLSYIVDPSILNGQLEEGCLRGLDEETYNKYIREWIGYGKYSVFVPGMQDDQ